MITNIKLHDCNQIKGFLSLTLKVKILNKCIYLYAVYKKHCSTCLRMHVKWEIGSNSPHMGVQLQAVVGHGRQQSILM